MRLGSLTDPAVPQLRVAVCGAEFDRSPSAGHRAARNGSVRAARLCSAPFCSVRLCSAQVGSSSSARLGSARPGSARIGSSSSARLGPVRFGSALLGSARPGSALFGSTRYRAARHGLPQNPRRCAHPRSPPCISRQSAIPDSSPGAVGTRRGGAGRCGTRCSGLHPRTGGPAAPPRRPPPRAHPRGAEAQRRPLHLNAAVAERTKWWRGRMGANGAELGTGGTAGTPPRFPPSKIPQTGAPFPLWCRPVSHPAKWRR